MGDIILRTIVGFLAIDAILVIVIALLVLTDKFFNWLGMSRDDIVDRMALLMLLIFTLLVSYGLGTRLLGG